MPRWQYYGERGVLHSEKYRTQNYVLRVILRFYKTRGAPPPCVLARNPPKIALCVIFIFGLGLALRARCQTRLALQLLVISIFYISKMISLIFITHYDIYFRNLVSVNVRNDFLFDDLICFFNQFIQFYLNLRKKLLIFQFFKNCNVFFVVFIRLMYRRTYLI